MIRLALAALLAAGAGAEEPELSNDVELRRELEKAETTNLENAAAGAEGETHKGLRLIRALLIASSADLDSARAELESLLRDPQELRRQLGSEEGDPVESVESHHEALLMSGQLLVAKSQDFVVKAASVPIPTPEEDPVKLIALRSAYKAADRGADLRRAAADAAAAGKRLGVGDPWPTGLEALGALGSCLAELKEAAGQADAAAKTLSGGRSRKGGEALGAARETLQERVRALEKDARDLQQERDILRANLILQMADRQITGRRTR